MAIARSRHTGGHGTRCADVTNHAQTRASSSSVVRPCVPPPPHAISTKSSTRAPLAWSVACCRVPMPRSLDDSDDESARLHGAVPLPEEEYWSDEERGGAGDAEARPLDGPGPWGQQLQRTLGGPKVEEPVSLALLARLFAYVAAFSLALAFCEVLTMWASRRVAWAVRPRSLFALAWACTRCLCILALPYWYATFSAHALHHSASSAAQPGDGIRTAEAPGGVEGAHLPRVLISRWLTSTAGAHPSPPQSVTRCRALALRGPAAWLTPSAQRLRTCASTSAIWFAARTHNSWRSHA